MLYNFKQVQILILNFIFRKFFHKDTMINSVFGKSMKIPNVNFLLLRVCYVTC